MTSVASATLDCSLGCALAFARFRGSLAAPEGEGLFSDFFGGRALATAASSRRRVEAGAGFARAASCDCFRISEGGLAALCVSLRVLRAAALGLAASASAGDVGTPGTASSFGGLLRGFGRPGSSFGGALWAGSGGKEIPTLAFFDAGRERLASACACSCRSKTARGGNLTFGRSSTASSRFPPSSPQKNHCPKSGFCFAGLMLIAHRHVADGLKPRSEQRHAAARRL
mmetsp:Transcript_57979/g.135832  ORF Transcript_57979/g.135832 Transcript_57979/m.135832 type:complete len:228 (+) Transcript_57979:260-943(+)